jgi:hypothetical protein
MRPAVLAALAVLSVFGAGPAWAQKVKSPADLVPADTLLCLEFRRPGAFGKEIAGLFAGSALERVPGSLARVVGSRRVPMTPGVFGLFWCPEMVGEVQRLEGAGVSLIGFKGNEPRWLGVVLAGKSNLPGLALRAALVVEEARRVGVVEGVPVFQMRPPTKEKGGTAYALLPGAVLFGSLEEVREAIRRAKGKVKTPALASAPRYRALDKEAGEKPGLFASYDAGRLLRLDEKQLAALLGSELAAVGQLKQVIEPEGLGWGASGLTLDRGTLRSVKVVLRDPKGKGGLLQVLPSGPIRTELFHYVPADSLVGAALPSLAGRKDSFLRLLDEKVRKLGKKDEPPSMTVERMEKDLGIDLGKTVLDRTVGVTVAIRLKEAGRKGDKKEAGGARDNDTDVVLVLAADGAAAAKLWAEEVLPGVYQYLAGKKGLGPTTRVIGGKRVYTLSGGTAPLHYGRDGVVVVLGVDPALVARCLAEGTGKKGWRAVPKAAATLAGPADSSFLGVVKPLRFVALSLLWAEEKGPAAEGPKEGAAGREAAPRRALKVLDKVLGEEDLLLLRLQRRPDRFVSEALWLGLKPGLARMTDALLEGLEGGRKLPGGAPKSETPAKPKGP